MSEERDERREGEMNGDAGDKDDAPQTPEEG